MDPKSENCNFLEKESNAFDIISVLYEDFLPA
jgi:hypothetical protein